MSTEHQQYSTANQSVAILQYAQKHNMEIIRTYADHGKSGLDLTNRLGLQQLLKDAVEPGVDFKAVLVYDVSRWGRFQNPDQGASYEYALHLAHVRIHYCAEQFDNDGSLASSILKTLKRGMAGEFSRELSVKVFAGSRRIVELGYHAGGRIGYGFRRQLVGHDREIKQMLEVGQRKNIQSDRVILVLGPPDEIRVIRQIYKMYIDGHLTEGRIARRLNEKRVPWMGSKPWTRMCVRRILTNPVYIGANVYNRTSSRLHQSVVRNPRSEWIWIAGAFKPIVSAERFEQAREMYAERLGDFSRERLLHSLKAFIKKRRRVSATLINANAEMPSTQTYAKYFGSLRAAYELAGWRPEYQRNFINRIGIVREKRNEVASDMLRGMSAFGVVMSKGKRRCVFTTDSGIVISLAVVRCEHRKLYEDHWHVYSQRHPGAHFRVIARLTSSNDSILDFLIMPNEDNTRNRNTMVYLNPGELSEYRFTNLSVLSRLLQRIEIEDSTPNPVSSHPSSADAPQLARFETLHNIMCQLLQDEDFRTLLRADKHTLIPKVLCSGEVLAGEQGLSLVICEDYVAQILGQDRIRRYIARRHAPLLRDLESTS